MVHPFPHRLKPKEKIAFLLFIIPAGLLHIVLAAQGVQSVVKYCKFEYINGVTEGPSLSTAAAAAATLPGSVALGMTLALAALAATDGITMYLEVSAGSLVIYYNLALKMISNKVYLH